MAIVIGFDIHREQVTFDALDDVTGEVQRGRIARADRSAPRRLLASLPAGHVDVALEATTGWRFIVEELVAAGATAHLADPAETANLRLIEGELLVSARFLKHLPARCGAKKAAARRHRFDLGIE
jgi:ABC-type ATPase involved in cell division